MLTLLARKRVPQLKFLFILSILGLTWLNFCDDYPIKNSMDELSLPYNASAYVDFINSTHRNALNRTRLENLLANLKASPGIYPNTVVYNLENLFDTKNPPNNIHRFNFTLNPQLIPECLPDSKSGLLLLALVVISPSFFEKRQTIRETWGNSRFTNSSDLKVLFVVGFSKNESINAQIEIESRKYGDIIQEDYVDSYFNITIKVMGAFKWVSYFCPKVRYVLRINDHMQVNTCLLVNYLKNLPSPSQISNSSSNSYEYKNTMWGQLYANISPIRDKSSKFYTPSNEYEFEKFLPYMEGSAILISGDLAPALYNLSTYVYWPRFSISLEVNLFCN
jgi:hypothetical protein